MRSALLIFIFAMGTFQSVQGPKDEELGYCSRFIEALCCCCKKKNETYVLEITSPTDQTREIEQEESPQKSTRRLSSGLKRHSEDQFPFSKTYHKKRSSCWEEACSPKSQERRLIDLEKKLSEKKKRRSSNRISPLIPPRVMPSESKDDLEKLSLLGPVEGNGCQVFDEKKESPSTITRKLDVRSPATLTRILIEPVEAGPDNKPSEELELLQEFLSGPEEMNVDKKSLLQKTGFDCEEKGLSPSVRQRRLSKSRESKQSFLAEEVDFDFLHKKSETSVQDRRLEFEHPIDISFMFMDKVNRTPLFTSLIQQGSSGRFSIVCGCNKSSQFVWFISDQANYVKAFTLENISGRGPCGCLQGNLDTKLSSCFLDHQSRIDNHVANITCAMAISLDTIEEVLNLLTIKGIALNTNIFSDFIDSIDESDNQVVINSLESFLGTYKNQVLDRDHEGKFLLRVMFVINYPGGQVCVVDRINQAGEVYNRAWFQ